MKVVHRQVVSDDLVLDDNGGIEVNGDVSSHILPKEVLWSWRHDTSWLLSQSVANIVVVVVHLVVVVLQALYCFELVHFQQLPSRAHLLLLQVVSVVIVLLVVVQCSALLLAWLCLVMLCLLSLALCQVGDLDLLVLSVLYCVCLSSVVVSVVVVVVGSCVGCAGAGDCDLLCGGDSGTGMIVAGSGVTGIAL